MGKLQIYYPTVDFRSYPYKDINVLLNPVDHGRTEYLLEKSRNLLRTANAKNVILDSGGHTIYNFERNGKQITHDPFQPIDGKKTLNITPTHLIDIATELKPTAVVALDWPLKKCSNIQEEEKEFRKKIKINIEWAKETAALRDQYCPDVKLLVAIQAKSFEQLELFLKGLSGLKIAGLSLPYRNMTPTRLILFLTRVSQLGVKWVHILGTTSFTYLAIAAYFARNGLFNIVSLDSTTWKRSGNSSGFFSPHNLLMHIVNEATKIPDSVRNDCPCPFCSNMSFEAMKHSLFTDRSLLLSCHNAWVIAQAARDLYRNAKTIDQLHRYMENRSPNNKYLTEVVDALYLVDQLKDESINLLRTLIS